MQRLQCQHANRSGAKFCDELGGFVEGRWHAAEAACIAEMAEHLNRTIYAHCCLGCLALRQGDLTQASSVLERALASCRTAAITLYRTMGMTFWLQRAASTLAQAEGR